MPMRNRLEARYTAWHQDIAFPLLRPVLANEFRGLCTKLPTLEQALEWRRKYEEYVAARRQEDEGGLSAAAARENEYRLQWLHDKSAEWSPPPHKWPYATPVPPAYFRAATGFLERQI